MHSTVKKNVIVSILCLFFNLLFVYAIIADEYLIGPDDLLQISVYDQPDLSVTVRVSPGGTITYPLLGTLRVDEMSGTDIQMMIEKKLLEDYLVNPQVTVLIKEYKSKKIYVLGEVVNPGLYELSGKTTIMEAISRAGGIKAGGSKKCLINRKAGTEEDGDGPVSGPIKIDLKRLFEEGDTTQNIEVLDGDVIHVPKANSIFIFGEVKRPGSYVLDQDITLLQAITQAGGFTKIAAPNRTKIIREENGLEKNIKVDVTAITRKGDKSLDILLLPNDIVIVPESYF